MRARGWPACGFLAEYWFGELRMLQRRPGEATEEGCRARLQRMADKAMDAMENSLHASDGRLALQLLKELGFLRRRKAGATEAEDVKRELKVEEGRRKQKLREAEMDLEMKGGGD